MANTSSLDRRSGKGNFNCPDGVAPNDDANSFPSWSETWARETAAIERAQRITYATAVVLVVLATVALLFPKALFG